MTMDKRISLGKENIEYLRRAFSHFFPEDAIYAADKPFESGEFNWKNRADFIDFVYRLTGISIKSEKDLGAIKKAQFEIENLLGESPSPEKPVEANIPDKEARALQELERQKREADLEKTRINAEQEIKRSIEKQQKIQEYLKNRKVVVTPTEKLTEVTLTPDEKEKIYNLAQAVKIDPGTTQKIIEQKIQESVNQSSEEVRQNISPFIVKQAAKDLSEKIGAFTEYKTIENVPDKYITYNQASPFAALINKDDIKLQDVIPDSDAREGLVKSAQSLAISLESESNVYAALTDPLFENSKNISSLFYPKQVAEFQISEEQNEQETRDEGIEINLERVYKQGNNIWDTWKKLANKEITVNDIFTASSKADTALAVTTGATVAEAEAAEYSLPIVVGAVFGLEATNTLAVGAFSTTALAVPGSQITQIIIGGGASQLVQTSALIMGNVDKIFFNAIIPGTKSAMFVGSGLTIGGENMLAAGLSIGKSKIALAITAKGVSVAATGAFASAIGFLATPIGGLVMAAGTWLASKAAPWVKKNAPYLIGTVLGLGAFAIAGPVVGIITGVGAFGLASAAAGGSFSLGAVGASIGGLFSALGGAVFTAIGTPILVTLLTLPIAVALILFIINSGAYVVPVGSSITAINFSCKTDQNGDQSLPTSDSPSADAAICIVSYLKQFNLNPLTGSLVGSTSWNNLEKVLAKPALDALSVSATHNNYLQCVGFTSATAGLAYNQAFAQINACSYINHPPAGYSYVSGINGIKSGDFFVMDGVDGCSDTSPGHIGVVVSVDGALISCADANMTGAGQVRATRGCFALAQLSGYLRKQ